MISKIKNTAKALMAPDKGILAMDESNLTCNKRFADLGIPQTADKRREYRQLLITTPGLNQYISGAILYDETVGQRTNDGHFFVEVLEKEGIIPGIKVDEGVVELAGFPGEKMTIGLDGLDRRLKEYVAMGLRFAKWRSVITIANGSPTDTSIDANMESLAQYAALCQEADILPIVEPEVLMEGAHSMETCCETTTRVLHSLFNELYKHKVKLEGLLLKPNMILPGLLAKDQNTLADVAITTVRCFLNNVPAAVGGIAFLSGGQKGELASARLNEMNKVFADQIPWPMTFSFSRALQLPALEIWQGKEKNKNEAQQALLLRAQCNSAARQGVYMTRMEEHRV